MVINSGTIAFLNARLTSKETYEIIHFAKKVHKIERKHVLKVDALWDNLFDISFDQIRHGQEPDLDRAFLDLIMEHFIEVTQAAVSSVQKSNLVKTNIRMAALPKSLKDLMKAWDKWRTKKTPPRYQSAQANQLKKAYLEKLQKVWGNYQDDWAAGKISKEEIKEKIKKEASTTKSRANTIIETETTRYWNQTRKNIYDEVDTVTHYLYLPIRDAATTPWCYPGVKSDKRINSRGLRGRGRLVYSKNDPELDKVCPSHWNCRSELVPLTPANDRHKNMINDKTLARRNYQCVPLPQGWG